MHLTRRVCVGLCSKPNSGKGERFALLKFVLLKCSKIHKLKTQHKDLRLIISLRSLADTEAKSLWRERLSIQNFSDKTPFKMKLQPTIIKHTGNSKREPQAAQQASQVLSPSLLLFLNSKN